MDRVRWGICGKRGRYQKFGLLYSQQREAVKTIACSTAQDKHTNHLAERKDSWAGSVQEQNSNARKKARMSRTTKGIIYCLSQGKVHLRGGKSELWHTTKTLNKSTLTIICHTFDGLHNANVRKVQWKILHTYTHTPGFNSNSISQYSTGILAGQEDSRKKYKAALQCLAVTALSS